MKLHCIHVWNSITEFDLAICGWLNSHILSYINLYKLSFDKSGSCNIRVINLLSWLYENIKLQCKFLSGRVVCNATLLLFLLRVWMGLQSLHPSPLCLALETPTKQKQRHECVFNHHRIILRLVCDRSQLTWDKNRCGHTEYRNKAEATNHRGNMSI